MVLHSLDAVILALSLFASLGAAIYSFILIRRERLDFGLNAIPAGLFLMFERRLEPFIGAIDKDFRGFGFGIFHNLIGLFASLLILIGLLSIVRIARERLAAQARIESLLAEKELILREVHHRVKNNFNSMKALLLIQAESQAGEESASALRLAAGRLDTMVMLYNQLFKSDDFLETSIRAYLPDFVRQVVSSFPLGDRVVIEIDVEDFILDTRKLQALAIVVNELITNSMKYAFKEADGALISVSASLREGSVKVTIRDNGVGLREPVAGGKPSGFGLTLVAGMARQLEGTITRLDHKGACYLLEFPA